MAANSATDSIRQKLLDTGFYLGDASNAFRENVIWKQWGKCNLLFDKDSYETYKLKTSHQPVATASQNDSDDNTLSDSDMSPPNQPSVATLYCVVTISCNNCFVTPCANWHEPMLSAKTSAKTFADIKISFQGEYPEIEHFDRDFQTTLDNVNWLTQQIRTDNVKDKGLFVPNGLRFWHALFEVYNSLLYSKLQLILIHKKRTLNNSSTPEPYDGMF